MKSVASVKDRLNNKSKATGKTMQELLTAYGLERAIYRLSVSKYKENFTLKGGIFLYAIFDGDYSRTTTDIDLLAQRISNDTEEMKRVFADVFSIVADDPLRFDLDTLAVKSITEFKKYHGVNVSILAYLDRTRIEVSIDTQYDYLQVFYDTDDSKWSLDEEIYNRLRKKEKIMLDAIANRRLEVMPTSDEDLDAIFSRFDD